MYTTRMAKRKKPYTWTALRELRDKLRMTQQEIADRLGISRVSWARYESKSGGRTPSPAVCHLIDLLIAGKI